MPGARRLRREGRVRLRAGHAAAPAASAFPAPDGRTPQQLLADYPSDDNLVVTPASLIHSVGKNRFGFAVFQVDRTQVTDAEVALYAAPASGGKAEGPYPARVESLETEAAFVAENTASDPDAAKAVYVSDLDLDRPGDWNVVALIRDGDGFKSAAVSGVAAGNDKGIPKPGDMAPVVHTPTADSVGDISTIDTRVPPSSMHEDDLADVLGKEPVVLVFATPALCQSRVCGPVVDVAEQVKRDFGDEVAFIHMEIYEDNIPDPDKLRPQVEAYSLPTEPWIFVIDADGRISSRFEGAISVAELTERRRKGRRVAPYLRPRRRSAASSGRSPSARSPPAPGRRP